MLGIKSAIRPILSGRLPAVRKHPEYQNIAFFNGLGSRGALQAPYCAEKLVNHLDNASEVPEEISIRRFYD